MNDSDIPTGWRWARIGDVLDETQYGLNLLAASEGNMPIVGMKDLMDGHVSDANLARVTISEFEAARYLLRDGDILLNRTNSADLVGKIGYVDGLLPAVFASYLVRLKPNRSLIDPKFLAFWLCSSQGQEEIRPLITRGVSQANINPTALCRHVAVPLPPLSEQRRIAEILATWDKALDALDRQIDRKERVANYLREALTSGTRRLDGRNRAWSIVKLGDVSRHLNVRNGSRYDRERVMGVTKAEGLVPMKEHVIAADIARYLVLPPQAFAYNPMRINIGSIVMSEAGENVIVSPDYVVFACHAERCHPRFINHLRRTRAWRDFMAIAGNGSVRVRIYYDDLANFEFHLPPLADQMRIIAVLDDAERELAALRRERRGREVQRDALASQLLTGRLRVPETGRLAAAG